MRKYFIDEANERQPQVLQVNSEKIRLYFDHSTEEREGMDGEKVTVHVAKYVELPVSAGSDALALAKYAVLAEIKEHDDSSAVNEFSYQDVPMWLDKDTRAGLKMRFEAEQAASLEETTLWYGTQSFTLPIATALQLLNALEVYASKCYDKTAEHKAAVAALEDADAVIAYNYEAGYPPKLKF